MLKLVVVLLSAVLAVALAGYHHGHHGHHGHHSPHGGWGWRKYYGWANVNAWQTPWAYQYSLNEHGNGYNKFAWASQNFKGWHG